MTGHSAQQPPSPVMSGMGLANPTPNGPAFETRPKPLPWILPYIFLEDRRTEKQEEEEVCSAKISWLVGHKVAREYTILEILCGQRHFSAA